MGISVVLHRLFYSQSKVVQALERTNKLKQSSHPSYVYVLGCGYKFNAKSVFVSASDSRFLFNCGPGTSRLLNEHKGKFRKLSAVFATRSGWENIGGLLSVAFKLNDSKNRDCAVYGFPGIIHLLRASQHFLHMHHSKLLPSNGDYSDKNTYISEIILKPDGSLNSLTANFSSRKGSTLEETVTAYIMTTKMPKARHVNVEKILEMGITPGWQLVNLLNGESVTLRNGQVVRPEDVTSDFKRNIVVAIDCPSEDYLSSVEDNVKFRQSYIDSKECNTTVIHFSPPHVMKCPRYIKWMKNFSSLTHHLIVNESNLVDGLITLRYRQLMLSKLHPGFFPPLKENGFYWLQAKHHSSKNPKNVCLNQVTPFVDSEHPNCVQEEVLDNEEACQGSPFWLSQWKGMEGLKIYEGRPGTRIPFRPFGVERFGETVLDEFLYHQGFKTALPQEILASMRQKFLDVGADITKPLKLQAEYENSYPRVIFLGTGSKTDSRDRNVPGILLRISKNSSIILDCGEGTHAQIHRLYGDEAPEIFRTINAVYVSHLHGDHHVGLTSIIRERAKALKNERATPLLLFATQDIEPWFNFTKRFLPDGQQFIHVPLNNLLHDVGEQAKSKALKGMDYVYSKTGFVRIQTARVPHCKESYGVALQHADGWKITYSGDTMFTDRLKKIGEGSDLLIHEATYDDMHDNLAIKNRHCTVGQAIETGRRMNAKFTILTHVSQRYSIIPSEEMSTCTDFSFAFDFMQVPLRYCHHLPILHELYSYLNDAYVNEDRFDEEAESLMNA